MPCYILKDSDTYNVKENGKSEHVIKQAKTRNRYYRSLLHIECNRLSGINDGHLIQLINRPSTINSRRMSYFPTPASSQILLPKYMNTIFLVVGSSYRRKIFIRTHNFNLLAYFGPSVNGESGNSWLNQIN